MSAELLKKWRANPRRWDPSVLMALPVGARVFEDGVFCKRTSSGLSWGIYYREPIVPGSSKTKPKQEVLPHCRNKTQAEGVLASTKGAIFQGTYQPKVRSNETTLAQWLPKFVELKGDRATIKKYEGQIKRQFIKRWGAVPLRALKRADVQAWYVARLAEKKTATANNELAALRSFFSEAIAHDKCEVNPCKGIKARAANNSRDRVLSDPETAQLATAAKARTDYAQPLYFTLYFTGARLSEVFELEWANVDLVRAVIRFRDAKDGRPRAVPMHDQLADTLRAWQASATTAHVFPGRLKGQHRVRLGLGWSELCSAAKVRVTPHELRHNFVSQLQARGEADTIIMDLTGHRTLAMLRRYSHSRDHHRAAAIGRMPAPGQSPGNHLRLTRVV